MALPWPSFLNAFPGVSSPCREIDPSEIFSVRRWVRSTDSLIAGKVVEPFAGSIGWSARALERRPGGVEAIAARALQGLAPGAILLLHEGPRVPAAIRVHAIRRVLERLHEQDYRCVVPGPGQLADPSVM